MKRGEIAKKLALPALAAAMVLGTATGPATSYFTTYVTAQGGYELRLRDVEVIPHETVDANVKNITIENTGDVECYVRVRVESGNAIPIAYSGEGWFDGNDGYWYYSEIVPPHTSTGVLRAEITLPTSGEESPIPEGTTVNVIVVSEAAKVLYDDEGNAKPNGPGYEGWTLREKEG